jgi:hypothetical protein
LTSTFIPLVPLASHGRRGVFTQTWTPCTQSAASARSTPAGSAVVLGLPPPAEESVTTEEPRVERGKALINMPPGEYFMAWILVFEKQDSIALTPPDTRAWAEV